MAGAVIGAAGSIGGAMIAADAQRAAAAAQERIAAQDIAFQRDVYEQNVARMNPWVQYGQTQMNALAAQMPSLTAKYTYGDYQRSPEYQNVMAETARQQKALEAKSAASGMYGSGTMANQLQQNAGYLAQQGYQQGLQNYWGQNQNIYNMLDAQSRVGLNAAQQQVGAGQAYASQVGATNQQLGNALARSAEQQGQAWSNAISGVGNIGMNYMAQRDRYQQEQDMLSRLLGSGGSPQSNFQTPISSDVANYMMPMMQYGATGQVGPTVQNSFMFGNLS